MKRIIFCGGRNYDNVDKVRHELLKLDPAEHIIVHGDYKGLDRLAGRIAKELGFEVEPVPAKWNKYGGAAGPIRNARMANLPNVVKVIAFSGGDGTANMKMNAEERGIEVELA